jgi:hypothetical protein
MPRTPIARTTRLAAAVASAALLALALAGCTRGRSVEDPPDFGTGASAPIDIDCVTGTSSVLAGSSPFLVTARVTRGNAAVSGATVVFASTRGLVQPSTVITDSTGLATAQFTPPGTAGDATITMQVTDRRLGDTATTSCSIAVTNPGNPRLNVQMVVPDQAAGLEVTVQYDSSRVDLASGAARAAGAFANPGCLGLANDDNVGVVELDIACSTLVGPTGTAATFDFTHIAGGELSASDFAVSCAAFDTQGRAIAAACTSSVTQL